MGWVLAAIGKQVDDGQNEARDRPVGNDTDASTDDEEPGMAMPSQALSSEVAVAENIIRIADYLKTVALAQKPLAYTSNAAHAFLSSDETLPSTLTDNWRHYRGPDDPMPVPSVNNGGTAGQPGGNSGSTPPPANPGGMTGGGAGGNPTPPTDGPANPSPQDPEAANLRPSLLGPVYLWESRRNTSIIITTSMLLAGASDADGDALQIMDLAVDGGTLSPIGADRWLFTPDEETVGPVIFHYKVSDGTLAADQSAQMTIRVLSGEQIVGTEGEDFLIGTPHDDIIDALGGDDIVHGREGNDTINGGSGADRLIGGDGNDTIHGGDGDDIIFGGAGDDVLFGDAGADILHGEEGDDVLDGGSGNDLLNGGVGNDVLEGGDGADILRGEAGNDLLEGGNDDDTLEGGDGEDTLLGDAGDDRLFGAAGHDVLIGGEGDDKLEGGSGDDRLIDGEGEDCIDGGEGDDVILLCIDGEEDTVRGGSGSDTLDLRDIVFDTLVDLPDGRVVIADGTEALIFQIENVVGGWGRDRLVADDEVNIFVGGAGNDTFVFRSLEALTNDGGPSDHIKDFSVGDRIDFSRIESDDDAFLSRKLFYAGPAREGTPAEVGALTYQHRLVEDEREITVIKGNLDDDEEPEFQIVLHGHHDLKAWDFILAGREAEPHS